MINTAFRNKFALLCGLVILVTILLCLLLTPSSAISDTRQLSYDCVIQNVYDVDDTGALKASGWQEQFIDGEFSVSRKTGEIYGQTLTTLNAKDTYVVNHGSHENSFKAVAEFRGQIQVIEIKEFIKGLMKPFVAMSMGGAGIVTGTCE